MPGAQPLLPVKHGAHKIGGVDEPLHQGVAAALANERDGPFRRLLRTAGVDDLSLARDAQLINHGSDYLLVAGEDRVSEPLVKGHLHRLYGLPVRRRRDEAAAAETAAVIYHFVKGLIHRHSSPFI